MKIVAALQADLEVTPLGTRSRLAEELRGVPVLRRTVERVRAAESVAQVLVSCPADQHERCRRLLEGSGAEVVSHDGGATRWAALVRSARKWSMDAWRGGIGGTTVFDEYTDCRLIDELARTAEADGVLVVSPAAVVFDPQLAERMIERRGAAGDEVRMIFATTPPGVSGILLDAGLVHELAAQNLPIGWLFSYQPDQPRKDPVFQDCCIEVPAEVRFAHGRLMADTERSMRRLANLLAGHSSPDAQTASQWLLQHEEEAIEPMPREVEVELTTDDPYPQALLRPRGDRVPRRGPLDLRILRRLAEELTTFDDSLIVFGGFGEPLRHPQFADALAACQGTPSPLQGEGRVEGRAFGLGVRTAGVDLTDAIIEAMIEARVDVLSVVLDAWTPELYARINGGATGGLSAGAPASLAGVRASIDRVAAIRADRRSACPIVVPELTKAKENVAEMEAFYDGWLRSLGSVCITAAGHYARQFPDHGVMKMAPSPRTACRRLRSRCVVLADGRVAACDQDFKGSQTVGDLRKQSLAEIWQGPELTRLRDAHHAGQFEVTSLCGACDEWHRP
jgi:radical SAM protein with 4Fe4S-binding SPASM domain